MAKNIFMTSTLFTAAIILGAIFIFIVFFIALHKKKHNKKLEKQKVIFTDLVWKNKLEISEKENINSYLLALDKINFVLLYIHFKEEKEEVELIDLWRIKAARAVNEDNSIYEQKKGKSLLVDKQITKIQLEVLLHDMTKVNLALYEYQEGIQDYMFIRRRANYWAEMINSQIKELPQSIKKAAGKVQG